MMKYLISLCFLSTVVWAYTPPIESMFRNGSNKEVTTNALSIQAKIEKFSKDTEVVSSTTFFKWNYHHAGGDRIKLLQIQLEDERYLNGKVIDRLYVKSLSPAEFSQDEKGRDQGVFFSIMNVLLINDGSFLVNFLKSRGHNLKLNDEAINAQKKELLNSYKNFISEGSESNKTNNPLAPVSLEEKQAVNKLLSTSLIEKSAEVRLEKCRNEFCWKIFDEKFEALVSDQTRQLVKLQTGEVGQNIEFYIDGYYLMNGQHTFPQKIEVRLPSGEIFKISFNSLTYFNEKEDAFLSKVRKVYQLNILKRTENRPHFVL